LIESAIDVVVSALEGFVGDEACQERFRTRRHEAFVEAKWLKRGRWTKAGEHRSRAIGIDKELSNLLRALDRGRCLVAGMLVFDDECFLDYHGDLLEW
jgi:hypothetical protein